jgi:putative FmdB family regulatory protein
MPTYQYRCGQCGEQFDARQSIHDDPLIAHESCGGTLAKVFGVGGIVLKGPGFYRNDSRSKSGSSNGDGESSSKAGGNGSSGDSKTGSDSTKKSEPASSGASKAGSSESGTSKSGTSKS